MNPLEVLARNFTTAVKYLEQPLENIKQSSIRELHLNSCKEVLSKPMPLKDQLLKKVLFVHIHNFTDKKLLETENIALLDNVELIINNYEVNMIKKIIIDEIELIALLITQVLSHFKVKNKKDFLLKF